GPSTGRSASWRPDCGRSWRQLGRAGPQRPLHQHAVEPTAELEADIVECADHAEAGGAMQLDGGNIGGIPDHRAPLPEPTHFCLGDQPLEQRAAYSAALRYRRDVDRILHAPAISRAGAMGAGG